MSSVSVPAIYDGNVIRLLETPPVAGPHRVLVTFTEVTATGDPARFWASLGAWQDDRPVEETLRDIHSARRSRAIPPAL
jgi:hypothetical protein